LCFRVMSVQERENASAVECTDVCKFVYSSSVLPLPIN
jgi:hypothetical protein